LATTFAGAQAQAQHIDFPGPEDFMVIVALNDGQEPTRGGSSFAHFQKMGKYDCPISIWPISSHFAHLPFDHL
jgi:hypothetical protein